MRVPVNLLSGFLGSGKTTLLNRLLADPAMADAAVLINEFGEVAVDHLLVDSIDDDIVVLESGCVCCSVRDDLGAALLSLAERQRDGAISPLRRVLLETTGIADPLPVCRQIMTDESLRHRYRNGPVLTIIDGVHGAATLDRHVEAVRQAVVADHLVISKVDLIDTIQCRVLKSRLHGLNPGAGLSHVSPDGDVAAVVGAMAARCSGADLPVALKEVPAVVRGSHDHRFSTFLLAWEEAVDWTDFSAWLGGLLGARGDQICRLKGLVNIRGEDAPILVQGVQQSFYPPQRLAAWPGTPRTELVLITMDLSRQAVMNSVADVLHLDCRS
jgi:G3E family GTPase